MLGLLNQRASAQMLGPIAECSDNQGICATMRLTSEGLNKTLAKSVVPAVTKALGDLPKLTKDLKLMDQLQSVLKNPDFDLSTKEGQSAHEISRLGCFQTVKKNYCLDWPRKELLRQWDVQTMGFESAPTDFGGTQRIRRDYGIKDLFQELENIGNDVDNIPYCGQKNGRWSSIQNKCCNSMEKIPAVNVICSTNPRCSAANVDRMYKEGFSSSLAWQLCFMSVPSAIGQNTTFGKGTYARDAAITGDQSYIFPSAIDLKQLKMEKLEIGKVSAIVDGDSLTY